MANQIPFDQFSPISGVDKNSFAGFTIKYRLPIILDRIIEDNDFVERVNQKLRKLKHAILNEKITYVPEDWNDQLDWQKWLKPYIGNTWFQLPFYFAEAYFYRLILGHVEYFTKGIDPFAIQKKEDLENSYSHFASILQKYQSFISNDPDREKVIRYLLFISLWGNKSDLSQLQLNRQNDSAHHESTIIDDSELIICLLGRQSNRMDIILDNSGVELFTDLVLVEKLIAQGICRQVVLHTKAFPTFVSDATEFDIKLLIDKLLTTENKLIKEFSESISSKVVSGEIIIKSDSFWNAPLHFFEFPDALCNDLKKSDLLIFKGDANYRRIYGDREFPLDIDTKQLSDYLPSTSLAIRILKSEILVGLKNETGNLIAQKDKDWLVNGKYGIIQMLK